MDLLDSKIPFVSKRVTNANESLYNGLKTSDDGEEQDDTIYCRCPVASGHHDVFNTTAPLDCGYERRLDVCQGDEEEITAKEFDKCRRRRAAVDEGLEHDQELKQREFVYDPSFQPPVRVPLKFRKFNEAPKKKIISLGVVCG